MWSPADTLKRSAKTVGVKPIKTEHLDIASLDDLDNYPDIASVPKLKRKTMTEDYKAVHKDKGKRQKADGAKKHVSYETGATGQVYIRRTQSTLQRLQQLFPEDILTDLREWGDGEGNEDFALPVIATWALVKDPEYARNIITGAAGNAGLAAEDPSLHKGMTLLEQVFSPTEQAGADHAYISWFMDNHNPFVLVHQSRDSQNNINEERLWDSLYQIYNKYTMRGSGPTQNLPTTTLPGLHPYKVKNFSMGGETSAAAIYAGLKPSQQRKLKKGATLIKKGNDVLSGIQGTVSATGVIGDVVQGVGSFLSSIF